MFPKTRRLSHSSWLTRLTSTKGLLALLVVITSSPSAQALESNRVHWAFQPLQQPAVPKSDFQKNPLDVFVAKSLRASDKILLPEADRRTLIRRLSFDLRGLPPSQDEILAFVADTRTNAFTQLVDRLLATPQYGERWGRHWLDVVGYADSNGYFNADSDRPLAWKYRDYVVRSINADKPFNRFIEEQIAGDEQVGYLAGGDITPERVDPLVATHFWRNAPDGSGESDGNPLEVKVDQYAVLEGNVQLIGSAFLGLTLQCARCHDHKFEPVSQQEYYSLQALIRPGFDPEHWLKPNQRQLEVGTRAEREAHEILSKEVRREIATLQQGMDGLITPFRKRWIEDSLAALDEPTRGEVRKALDAKEKDRNEAMKSLLKTHAARVDANDETLTKQFPILASAMTPLRDALKAAEAKRPAPLEQVAAFFENTNPPPTHHLLIRGNHASEGEAVSPGVPARLTHQVLFKLETAPLHAPSTGRRLALAKWLTNPDNGLVLRVLVNRVWRYHFGQGLVSTSENLGQSGARPSQPALLDWLCNEFIRSEWSLKQLHRVIVTSATYRQTLSATFPWGGPQRLDAESLRDAMLTVSGEIDLQCGGAYVPTKTDTDGQITIDEKQPGAHRRSLYLQQRRTFPVDFLSTFDGPSHNPVCVQRIPSTVAQQSLSLLNSEFVRTRARAFAHRVLHEAGLGLTPTPTIDARSADREQSALRSALELSYGRTAQPEELSAVDTFLRQQTSLYQDQPDGQERAWTDLCQMLLAGNAFLYVD